MAVSLVRKKVEEAIKDLEMTQQRLSTWPQDAQLKKELKDKAVRISDLSFNLKQQTSMLTDAEVRKTVRGYCDALGYLPPDLRGVKRVLEGGDGGGGGGGSKRFLEDVVAVPDEALTNVAPPSAKAEFPAWVSPSAMAPEFSAGGSPSTMAPGSPAAIRPSMMAPASPIAGSRSRRGCGVQ